MQAAETLDLLKPLISARSATLQRSPGLAQCDATAKCYSTQLENGQELHPGGSVRCDWMGSVTPTRSAGSHDAPADAVGGALVTTSGCQAVEPAGLHGDVPACRALLAPRIPVAHPSSVLGPAHTCHHRLHELCIVLAPGLAIVIAVRSRSGSAHPTPTLHP